MRSPSRVCGPAPDLRAAENSFAFNGEFQESDHSQLHLPRLADHVLIPSRIPNEIDRRVAHAVQPLELVHHIQLGVVGQIGRVIARVGAGDRGDQQDD